MKRQSGVDIDVDEVFPCIPNHIFAQQVIEIFFFKSGKYTIIMVQKKYEWRLHHSVVVVQVLLRGVLLSSRTHSWILKKRINVNY